MLKFIPFGFGLFLFAVSAHAEELLPAELIQKEFELDRDKIHEIFQDKIQKISARASLPDDMRNLLISQAAEVRQFDLDVLQKKRDLKLKQVRQRDDLKDRLRKDAENRAHWILDDEENFQKNRDENQEKDHALKPASSVPETNRNKPEEANEAGETNEPEEANEAGETNKPEEANEADETNG